MRVVAIIAIFLVGCATQTPDNPVAAKSNLEQAEQRLDQNEDKCIEEAAMSDDAVTSNVVMPLGALYSAGNPVTVFQARCVSMRGQRESSKETLAEDDRTMYENAEALDRKVPLPVLTWSLTP